MKPAFIDIDTQLDFVCPAGALYAPGAERVVPAVARLNRFAAGQGIPVISTTDAHAENDPEFRRWPPHCVAGTWGQRKAETTLLDGRVVIPNRDCDLKLEGARQIVVEKQTVDAFQTPNFARVVQALGAERFVLYGVVTEVCVFHAARGLMKMGEVTLVTDAVAALNDAGSRSAIEEMRTGGVKLASAEQVCR